MLFEIFQMFLSKGTYFDDIWNTFDLFRALLLLFYIINCIFFEEWTFTNEVVAALNFVTWVRAITFLRLF